MTMRRTRVVLIGAGFIADIHAECYHRFVPDAELVGVYSRSEARARAFADKHAIARWFIGRTLTRQAFFRDFYAEKQGSTEPSRESAPRLSREKLYRQNVKLSN